MFLVCWVLDFVYWNWLCKFRWLVCRAGCWLSTVVDSRQSWVCHRQSMVVWKREKGALFIIFTLDLCPFSACVWVYVCMGCMYGRAHSVHSGACPRLFLCRISTCKSTVDHYFKPASVALDTLRNASTRSSKLARNHSAWADGTCRPRSQTRLFFWRACQPGWLCSAPLWRGWLCLWVRLRSLTAVPSQSRCSFLTLAFYPKPLKCSMQGCNVQVVVCRSNQVFPKV